MSYEGISRPCQFLLKILTAVLLAMPSFGMLTSSCLFCLSLTKNNKAFVHTFSSTQIADSHTCDYCYHCYQSHRSHFLLRHGFYFFEDTCSESVRDVTFNIRRSLYWILRFRRYLQYPVYRSTWSGKSHIIHLHDKFGSCECKQHNHMMLFFVK